MIAFQIKVWTANPQQFVEDEDDDTFSYTVRIAAQDLLLVRFCNGTNLQGFEKYKPGVWNMVLQMLKYVSLSLTNDSDGLC